MIKITSFNFSICAKVPRRGHGDWIIFSLVDHKLRNNRGLKNCLVLVVVVVGVVQVQSFHEIWLNIPI